MGRVEEEAQARSQQETERLQKRIDRDARDKKAGDAGREAFGKLVKGQQQAHDTKKGAADKQSTDRRQGEQATQGAKTQSEAEKRAMMARNGLSAGSKQTEQARSFQGALQKVHTDTQQQTSGRVEKRDTGKQKDRVERDDRGTDQVQKADNKRDREADVARVEAHDEKRANAAINTGNTGSDAGSDSRGDEGGGGAAAAAAAMKAKPPAIQQAQAAQAAHEVKQIPPELLEKLVSTVHLAVNQRGLKEFQIELKEGVLSGATLKISAEGGKIALKFIGLDGHKKNLIESSKGELMRKLEAKGLKLSRLEV
jgi:hypothetical protein